MKEPLVGVPGVRLLSWSVAITTVLISGLSIANTSAEQGGEVALIDTLGEATPQTQFYYGGTSGPALGPYQFVGPQLSQARS